jgi:nucleoid-associated protein YgaU
MQFDCDVGNADRPQSRGPDLAIISIALALLGSVLVMTVGVPRLLLSPVQLPTSLELELLLRSPGAEQLTWVLAATSWCAWLIWAWLAVTVVVRVLVVLCERAAAGAAWVISLRAVSDWLTLPVVRRAVDASLAGLLLARVAGGWTAPSSVLAEAQTADVRMLDVAPAQVQHWAELSPADILYTVQPGDSLGKIAAHYYGDWAAYERIYEVNRQRQQLDGRVLEDARTIYPGWRLLIPSPTEAVKQDEHGQPWCVVQPGDSLSSIAARLLGNERRWTEVFELNREVARLPDGRRLTNPELVWPGLRLRLPDLDVASASAPAQRTQVESTSSPALGVAGVQPVGTSDPVQTVATYYQLLGQGDVAGAAELMRDGPRSVREASGGQLPRGRSAVRQAKVLHMDPYQRQASVTVDLEVTVDSRTPPQQVVVTWQLARGPQGWRLAAADVRQRDTNATTR